MNIPPTLLQGIADAPNIIEQRNQARESHRLKVANTKQLMEQRGLAMETQQRESDLRLQQTELALKQLQNAYYEDMSYRAWDSFIASGDANILNDAYQSNPGLQAVAPGLAGAANIDFANDQHLLAQAGIDPDADPDKVRRRYFKVIGQDGKQQIVDIAGLISHSRYMKRKSAEDREMMLEQLGLAAKEADIAQSRAAEDASRATAEWRRSQILTPEERAQQRELDRMEAEAAAKVAESRVKEAEAKIAALPSPETQRELAVAKNAAEVAKADAAVKTAEAKIAEAEAKLAATPSPEAQRELAQLKVEEARAKTDKAAAEAAEAEFKLKALESGEGAPSGGTETERTRDMANRIAAKYPGTDPLDETTWSPDMTQGERSILRDRRKQFESARSSAERVTDAYTRAMDKPEDQRTAQDKQAIQNYLINAAGTEAGKVQAINHYGNEALNVIQRNPDWRSSPEDSEAVMRAVQAQLRLADADLANNARFKEFNQLTSIARLGQKASNLSEETTGFFDSFIHQAKSYITDEVDIDQTEAKAAFEAMRNAALHAFAGSAMTQTEIARFTEGFGSSRQKQGVFLTKLRNDMEDAMHKLMNYKTFLPPASYKALVEHRVDAVKETINNITLELTKYDDTRRVPITSTAPGPEPMSDSAIDAFLRGEGDL